MIRIVYGLACNECADLFGKALDAADELHRRRLDDLRLRAAKKGWERFRRKTTAPMGDYCPVCAAKIRAEKAARGTVSAITGKPRRTSS